MAKAPKTDTDLPPVPAVVAPPDGWYGEDWREIIGRPDLSEAWIHGDIYQPDSRPKKPE